MRLWLHALFWSDEIFRCDDLPLTASTQPSICPDKTPALTAAPLPSLITLDDGSIAIKADFHVIEAVTGEILWRFARLRDHCCFVVEVPFGINTDKIVSE